MKDEESGKEGEKQEVTGEKDVIAMFASRAVDFSSQIG